MNEFPAYVQLRSDDAVDRLLAEWRQTLPTMPRFERTHRTICLIANLLHTLAAVDDYEARQTTLDLGGRS